MATMGEPITHAPGVEWLSLGLIDRIQQERADGSLWCCAVREARLLRRSRAIGWVKPGRFIRASAIADGPVTADELTGGIPVGWISR